MPRASFPALLLALAACAPTPARSPWPTSSTSESGAFVVRVGNDTVALERFTRTADRLRGSLVLRTPRTATRDYVAELAPDGGVRRLTVRLRTLGAPNGPLAPYTAELELRGDSVAVETFTEDTVSTRRIALRGRTVPSLRMSYALLEQALLAARPGDRGTASIALLPVGGGTASPLTARRAGAGVLEVDATEQGFPVRSVVRTDAAGRVRSWDATASTFKRTAERVAPMDVAALAEDFARRDRAGAGLGQLSPRDSASVRLGAAMVALAYGRPARRGRVVFGGMVPWGEVWRTGANVTTQLGTDRPLAFGDVVVPPGRYSLYTIPRREGWTLVFNRALGASGALYDPSKDVARVPMRAEASARTVERLEMGIEPAGAGGVLWVAWAGVRASVPFAVR